ncbi:MAG TPA: MFS transporter [Acidimicrobiales bacterium]|nr:MFS transporter [Acidimicrobiales bacterium]
MTARFRQWMHDSTGGLPFLPLGILFAVFFFDEWDTQAFNTLAPNIKHAFHLTDKAFGIIVIVNLSIVLLGAIPLGFYGDRLPRTKLVVVGGLIAGVFSALTGTAGILGILVVFRLLNGFGRLTNDSIHRSLLADYYRPVDRPQVFSIHQNATYLGAIVGAIVAGSLASIFSWRVAFGFLIVPIVAIAVVAALTLREPLRGGTDDEDNASEADEDEPVPFAEARRILLSVRTLRRQYTAWLFIGAGLVPLAFYLPLFLDRTFHVAEFGRGLAGGLNAAATFAGVLLSGRLTRKWMADGLGEPIKRAGVSLMFVGVGIGITASSPWLWMAVVLGAATSFVAGLFFPPFFATQAFVSPARVRTLSFGFGSLFIVAGAWLLFILPGVINISDNVGIRAGLLATVPYWIIGGLVLRSAHRFVADDTTRALGLLSLTAELRRDRRSGKKIPLLQCKGVEVAYDQVQVLFGADLEVEPGEIVALLGTNGAGKSTLLKAISGVVDPIGGAIFFNGRDITHADGVQTTSMGVIQVPGGKAVFPTLSVAEHLRAAGWLYRDDPEYLKQANEEVLVTFPRLRERLDQMAGNLSGGEQQMLALGMAFIAKPKLLMIDELSLGLAPTIVEQLLEIVRRIRDAGTAIILVEQSINVALTVAERAYFMEKGEVRFHGPTAELLERDDIVRSVFLEGASAATDARRGARVKADSNGHAGRTRLTLDQLAERPVVLELVDVVMRFGGIRAVDEASLELHEGEILGLIGPNGAGKTTIFDLISGFLVPDQGRIRYAGEDITEMRADQRAWLGLGRSFQDARLVPSLTVAENLAIGLERHIELRDHVASFINLPGIVRLEEDVAWTVEDLVELMHLGAFRDKFVRELSTGSRRIVDLAMCIAHDPKVLLLDEPSSGIAQRETEALGPLLERIQRETDCALLVIEHDMPLITSVSDRIVALELGHPIAEGAPADVIRDPQVISSYLGGDIAVINRSGGGRKRKTRTKAGA